MFPIFCFDGNDSPLKKLITKDRLKDFRFAQQWYHRAIDSGNNALAKKIALGKDYLWQNIIFESKQLLNALGVPFIDSPASAESQCAQIVKSEIAFYSISQDFDSLLFGCPRMVRNLIKSRKRKVQGKWKYYKIEPQEIRLNDNLKRLGITLFQLVDMAILTGSDYFKGIYGIGPKTAFKLVQNYNNLEHIIIQEKKNYDFSHLTYELISEIRKIFLIPTVLKNFSAFSWNHPLESKVLELLCEDHYLNKDRVYKNLKSFTTNYYQCHEHFGRNFGKSRQVQTTLDQIIGGRI